MGGNLSVGSTVRLSHSRTRCGLGSNDRCRRLDRRSAHREKENMIATADDYIVLGILAPIVLLLFLIK